MGQSQLSIMEPVGSAYLSPCQRYRYTLTRRWAPGGGTCAFIGLNPSTADATEDDNTILRCIDFAKRFGANELLMLNLFALRATDPADMKRARSPIGLENDAVLARECLALQENAGANTIICAWGADGVHLDRARQVYEMLTQVTSKLFSLGTTKHGQPRHPLYLRKDTPLQPWRHPDAPDGEMHRA